MKKTSLSSIDEVKKLDNFDLDKKCYIIWNDESYPVIESIVGCVVNVFDDVAAVSFDTWIFIPENKKSY